MIDWAPIFLTFKLAFTTTLLLFILAIPIANWLATSKSKIKTLVETLVSMPLVLPPTVIGFYFLIAFSPKSMIGSVLENLFSLRLVFSFEGLVIASIIYSLPFMVQPIQSGLSHLPENLKEASYILGKNKYYTLFKVSLPNIKPSLLTGIVLTFAHTIGEFGVVLMIGGNIPDETRVASIAIYDQVEALNYDNANIYALILFSITFLIILSLNLINKKQRFKVG